MVIYLQRWTGSQWVSLDSRTFSAVNTWYVCGSWAPPVPSGCLYRGLCRHVVTEGGVTQSSESVTRSVQP